jgi:ERF superfamily protein
MSEESGLRLNPSLAAGKLAGALAAAQAEFPTIEKSRKVDAGTYSYSYAPLEDVFKAVRDVLAKHELAITQPLDRDDQGRAVLRTTLMHVSGGSVGGEFPLALDGLAPQQQGQRITYARRYALISLLGLATEEDVDSGPDAQQAPRQEPQRRTPAARPVGPQVQRASREQLDHIVALGDRLAAEEIVSWTAIKERLPIDYGGVKEIEYLSEEQAAHLIGRLQAALDNAFNDRVY